MSGKSNYAIRLDFACLCLINFGYIDQIYISFIPRYFKNSNYNWIGKISYYVLSQTTDHCNDCHELDSTITFTYILDIFT